MTGFQDKRCAEAFGIKPTNDAILNKDMSIQSCYSKRTAVLPAFNSIFLPPLERRRILVERLSMQFGE
ncbi:hypothetical protein KIN20_034336 [Parelaphostrongylus tenuis]|uniref:Uncharacterized protein n=1 Tax=Parelaphostrongylus tenuis TaxID=148309 RepID=A0AAD5R9E4_PARTN|nr:hypothetical protein KIN20_034336 [Parelaphostrongylus tenuis]